MVPLSRSENTRLTVGKDTEMSGEIATCDLLVVEGTVGANLRNGREIQIGRSGRFSGLAEVEDAGISGEFSGKFVMRRLSLPLTPSGAETLVFWAS